MLASMPIVRVTNRKGPLSHTMHDIRGHKRRAAPKTYRPHASADRDSDEVAGDAGLLLRVSAAQARACSCAALGCLQVGRAGGWPAAPGQAV